MSTPTVPLHWFELPHAPAPGTELGQRDELADACATLRNVGDPQTPFRLLLLRQGEAVHAFVNRCTHFGVPLAQRQEQLLQQPLLSLRCNVHYTRYRWSDGACLSGECAGQGLLPVPLDIAADGTLRIAESAAALPP